jgi:hypothetical protein
VRGDNSRRVARASTIRSLANGTLNQLQAAPRASGDAARPLPRLRKCSAGAKCNGRDAVANESAEALQRRAKVSAVCQLQLVVGRRRMIARFYGATLTYLCCAQRDISKSITG